MSAKKKLKKTKKIKKKLAAQCGGTRVRVRMLIAGREYFYSYAKTFVNVKFSICTGKERVFSVKGCVLSKQVVNLARSDYLVLYQGRFQLCPAVAPILSTTK